MRGERLLVHVQEGLGADLLRRGNGVHQADGAAVVDGDLFSVLGALGRNEDHARRGARTVDGGCGGVLEDGDGLDVFGIQGVQFSRDVVDQDQRADGGHARTAAGEGGGTADLDAFAGLSGRIGRRRDVQAGDGALEGGGHVRLRPVTQDFVHLDRGHGTGQVHLLLDTVAHDDGFLQQSGVFFEDDGQGGSGNGNDPCDIADAGDLQEIVFADGQVESAVFVGDGPHTVLALEEDGGPDDGLSGLIGDRSGDF